MFLQDLGDEFQRAAEKQVDNSVRLILAARGENNLQDTGHRRAFFVTPQLLDIMADQLGQALQDTAAKKGSKVRYLPGSITKDQNFLPVFQSLVIDALWQNPLINPEFARLPVLNNLQDLRFK